MNDRKPKEQIIDTPVGSVFVDGLSAILPAGAVTHLIFTVRQPDDYNEPGRFHRLVQAHLTVPTDQLPAIGQAIAAGRLIETAAMDDAGEPVAVH